MKTMKSLLVAVLVLVSGSMYAQDFTVNASKSTVKWEGKKIGGTHHGHIGIKEGKFSVKGDKLASGTFVIDMQSMTNDDLEDPGYNEKLIGHLKSDDFFSVTEYPTATLKITESTKFKSNKATVKGDLTIKGKTNPIEFEVTRQGNVFTGMLVVDRSKYDVRYGSKSFFDNLGDKVIYDDFTLDVKLVTK
eukprot:Anaeramoba_flamelloidesa1054525_41.p2 GENE.a1054525_41~~a1054525_41.p2  ORF type:complete len:190 (+),score=22.11 a1054525_41:728-1297(+)